jgi:hypothetical protein
MQKIFKYRVPVLEKFTLELPKDAKPIRIATIEGEFFMWAIVDPAAPTARRNFESYKTGQPIETDLSELVYLGHFELFIMQELCLYVFENVSQVS